jgi:prepilin-type N-terminal cleavage/methylation domain-containing protein
VAGGNEFSGRRGFTVLELLVTIAIIGMLVAIIVPATMAARESSRRLECQNRLRQFGLAIHQFESSHGHLPDIYEPFPGLPMARRTIPIQIKLLPYLDQAAAYSKIQDRPQAIERDEEFNYRFSVFHCPSDISSTGISYRVCIGRNAFAGERNEAEAAAVQSEGYGAFNPRRRAATIKIADITDGLSNTAAMSERNKSVASSTVFDPSRDLWFSGVMSVGFDPDTESSDAALQVCNSAGTDPGTLFSNRCGLDYLNEGMHDSCYNHVGRPNSEVPDCSLGSEFSGSVEITSSLKLGIHSGVVSARSQHYGRTVNLLLMDGAVRPVSHNVDLEVWRSLGSRSDGELIGEF